MLLKRSIKINKTLAKLTEKKKRAPKKSRPLCPTQIKATGISIKTTSE